MTQAPSFIHAGSVKDIYQAREGEFLFEFSDRYSIFDWGTMPDSIPRKGEALARMGALFFEELSIKGLATHYLRRKNSAYGKPTGFEVKAVDVPRDQSSPYQSRYQNRPTWTLIPLEVIFRWGVPKGSSLLKRPGASQAGYVEGARFQRPLIEATTKLEKQDRLLSDEEAKSISNLSETEWKELCQKTEIIAEFLQSRFAQIGLELWDGKVEFAFGDFRSNGDHTDGHREIVLVDTIGLDELRLTFEGQIVSKEILRQFYIDSPWVQALQEAKAQDRNHFKKICIEKFRSYPDRLSPTLIQSISQIYLEVARSLEQNQKLGDEFRALLQSVEHEKNIREKQLKVLSLAPSPARVLILGGGGREHALAWRMAQDPGVEEILVMPGNPGMLGHPGLKPLLESWSLEQTLKEVKVRQVDLVVVGPEKYLLEGWSDALREQGVAVFGPSRAAAALEGSKAFAKEAMIEWGVPTAKYFTVRSLSEGWSALESARSWAGIVLKLSGPALGKGVVVTESYEEAKAQLEAFFHENPQGIEDGIVIEERLRGRETSLFFACEGERSRFLGSACDHKRLLDRDQGPNTGGMGAVSPAVWQSPEFIERIRSAVVDPVLKGMLHRKTPFRGMLFVGLLGESVLEFNVRWGDPETQALMPLLVGNLSRFFYSAARSDVASFDAESLAPSEDFSIHVVKAARGYPGWKGEKVESGVAIQKKHSAEVEKLQWYFAGVKSDPTGLKTAGGRVMGLTCWAHQSTLAFDQCYRHLQDYVFDGEQYRTDIGIEWAGKLRGGSK